MIHYPYPSPTLSTRPKRARRAILYMPGDDLHKIEKGSQLDIDCVCMDIEDGVAYNRKPIARSTIVEALKSFDFGTTERLVRINPIGSNLESQDLSVILPAQPDGIVLPKVETGDQILWTSDQISIYETSHNIPKGKIVLFAIIETALGVVNLKQIAKADFRLQALIFGAEDLAGDIGAQRTSQGWEVFYARSAVVTHAAAFDLQAIDMVHVDFLDNEGLSRESTEGVDMGFCGKQVIHPNQIDIVQKAFTPSDESIEQAQRIIAEYDSKHEAGIGAFATEGKLVDAPTIRHAYNILSRAREVGKIR